MTYLDPYPPDFGNRGPRPGVAPEFPHRWSPRSFVKTSLPPEELAILVEAARWAPSAYNEQPWRILTSTDDSFPTFLGLLAAPNQKWAKNAAVLGFMLAKQTFSHNGKPNAWAVYDCGSAWMSLTLQARKLGLYTHGMAGIDKAGIAGTFGVDTKEFEVVAGFAIGLLNLRERLEKPFLDWETPSARKPLDEIWKQGGWD